MAGPIVETDGPYRGWSTWRRRETVNFGTAIGPMWWQHDSATRTRVAIETSQSHANGAGSIHGGFLMSFADMVLYAASVRSLVDVTAVTLTCNTEFLGAGTPGEPLEAEAEVLRETGKVIFLRGIVRQHGRPVIAFSGTLRKVPRLTGAPADRQD